MINNATDSVTCFDKKGFEKYYFDVFKGLLDHKNQAIECGAPLIKTLNQFRNLPTHRNN